MTIGEGFYFINQSFDQYGADEDNYSALYSTRLHYLNCLQNKMSSYEGLKRLSEEQQKALTQTEEELTRW